MSNKSKLQELLQIKNPPREVREAIADLYFMLADEAADMREDIARAAASDAYHNDPKNPSSCQAYGNWYGYGSRCPCEDNWREFLDEG
jgi:hypothetical protein